MKGSKYVKTELDLIGDADLILRMSEKQINDLEKKKYLILPEGLNALENKLSNEMGWMAHNEKIHSIFTRFKKRHGIREKQ